MVLRTTNRDDQMVRYGAHSTSTTLMPSHERVVQAYALALDAQRHQGPVDIDWAAEAALWNDEAVEWAERSWPAAVDVVLET